MSQREIDSQARDAIQDLFPSIPQRDLDEIVEHAFELVSASPVLVRILTL